ncbi:hypothetical protein ATCV1_z381L [Acanthocystis turfacea chlorella virus 1]|uniref:Uncharacterized protein z381L n=1 Tax=Chlorovirus heliozoae TaxID=322019 RepID=A7K8Z1_9PHYC|nr:hypothetical protein ATCV1_z381L [Acanthocystis turfacea chlorella virus 1]ABT16515.1 hypothetical protein ATCV1_z381L [Acanthocystis turfacea chlorella virus 1]
MRAAGMEIWLSSSMSTTGAGSTTSIAASSAFSSSMSRSSSAMFVSTRSVANASVRARSSAISSSAVSVVSLTRKSKNSWVNALVFMAVFMFSEVVRKVKLHIDRGLLYQSTCRGQMTGLYHLTQENLILSFTWPAVRNIPSVSCLPAALSLKSTASEHKDCTKSQKTYQEPRTSRNRRVYIALTRHDLWHPRCLSRSVFCFPPSSGGQR